jgi:uncharacterized protein (TIGR03118 family)
MNFPSVFRRKRAASDRQHPYRPVLEYLEDRHLLSGGFAQVNLASDVPGIARFTDPNLVNPWGMAFSPTGPFWLADNGTGVSDLLDGRGQPVPLVVMVPSAARSDSVPTGTVFNGRTGFAISENGVSAPSRFLFASEDGTIAGWSALVDPTRGLLAVDNSSSGAVYTGLALATDPTGHGFLYAADFSRGTIDVFDQDFRPVVRTGSFQDPNLPGDFAPFNIQNINNLLFVAYAQRDEDRHDDVAGAGHGFIDVYDTNGHLVRRFASQGALNSPWGLALAPADFGPFGGALLVGNNGDGRINAYDPGSGTLLGELADDNGIPIAIPNLWALTFGNGHAGGASDTLFFAAGMDYDAHGLFGAIQPPARRGADTAGSGPFDPNGPGEPGDYPLPPRGGPTFQATSTDRPFPIADLLPLRESSLALVPTLSAISQPSTRIEALVPSAPSGGVSFTESVLGTVPASNTLMLILGDGNSPSAGGARSDAVALNTFLDLSVSQNVLPEKPGTQRPPTHAHALGARSSPPVGRDAGAEALVAELSVEQLDAQSSEAQGPEALPPSCLADEVIAVVPLESGAESADARAAGSDSVEAQHGGVGWTGLMNVLVVLGIPMLWVYWLNYGRNAHEQRIAFRRCPCRAASGPALGE